VISRVSRYAPGYGSVNANDGDAISAQSVVAVSTLYFISYLHISAQFSNNSKYYCINPIDRTISGVASQAVNSCFSATYQNYKIIFTLTSATADATIKARLRSGTTDNSASLYNFAMPGLTNAGGAANENSGPSSGGFLITYSDSGLTHYSSASIDLYKPFLAVYTTGTITMTNSSFSAALRANSGGLWHEVSSSFDGINFISDAGNITGEVSIYGYNK
jgi:hypothetical protein